MINAFARFYSSIQEPLCCERFMPWLRSLSRVLLASVPEALKRGSHPYKSHDLRVKYKYDNCGYYYDQHSSQKDELFEIHLFELHAGSPCNSQQ